MKNLKNFADYENLMFLANKFMGNPAGRLRDKMHEMRGQVKGKDGWYNPNSRQEVEEYLDKNGGARSYLDDRVHEAGSNNPNNIASTHNTPTASTAETIGSSLSSDASILQKLLIENTTSFSD